MTPIHDATGLMPRVQRLEDQFHQVNEKVHELSQSHAEALLMLETYMKEINSMKSTLLEVKDAILEIKMPDRDEWEKEMNLVNRLNMLEMTSKKTWNLFLYGGLGTAGILMMTWTGLSAERIVEVLLLLLTKVPH
jgi:hypothetical protein